MATDLTGTPLSEAYVGFLHTGGLPLTGSPVQIHTGNGVPTSLSISSTALNVNGSLKVGDITYPAATAAAGSIPTLNSSGVLEFKLISDILSVDSNSNITGTFGSPTIVFQNNRITSVVSNVTRNVYFMASRGTNSALPTENEIKRNIVWPSPIDGDIAIVIQKVLSATGDGIVRNSMTNIAIYEFEYLKPVTGNTLDGWRLKKTF